MFDNMLTTISVIVIAGILVTALVDATVFTVWIFHPLIRLFQRVFLGIDKVKSGPETLIGASAKIEEQFISTPDSDHSEGFLILEGERWRARSVDPVDEMSYGQVVDIVGRDGLVLLVSLSNIGKA